jgi:hypothetical protein
VNVPKRVNFNYFQSYTENVYRFVPRAIWPNKPDGIGIICAETFYNKFDQGGIPPGELGEAYWSLHILGVVIVFFIFGIILKFVGNLMAKNPKAIGFLVVYLLTILRFGPDQVSFRAWIFSLVPTLVFLVATNLMTLKSRE